MSESIYITLSQTGTTVAKIIKFFTRKPYNHSSISTDLSLSEMYSFCRTYTPFPLPAGFNREIVGEGTLGLFSYIPCEIYEIPLSQLQKDKFCTILEHFKQYRDDYSYNILGFWSIPFRIHIERKNKFVCSQFVAFMISEAGIPLTKPVCMYSPEDLRHLPEARLIYRGELNKYYAQFTRSHAELPAKMSM
ncbi:MAG: hypothetical protein Q4F95_14335 [Oscillospiraceae bacterium]|nr:hypothetical protein [Oscillospiraceae bacterium]